MASQLVPFRRPLQGLLILYVASLTVVFLIPRGDVPTTSVVLFTDLVLSMGGSPSLVTVARMEILLNVLIMVPLALLGRLLRPGYNWRDWTAVGFAIAVAVELVQGLFLPERSASAVDVIANTTGVGAGAVLGSLARWSSRCRRVGANARHPGGSSAPPV